VSAASPSLVDGGVSRLVAPLPKPRTGVDERSMLLVSY
jgi:hypothetical protein